MISYFDQFFLILSSNLIIISNLLIVFILSFTLFYVTKTSFSLLLSPWSIISNLFFSQFKNEVKTLVGAKDFSKGYLTFIFSLFTFILMLNILGLFPYVFSPTVHISITMGLSFSIVVGATIYTIFNYSDKFFSIFTPLGAPIGLAPALVLIETVSHIAKIISLGVRLAANITAGHLLLAIISSFGFKILLSSWAIATIIPGSILIFVIVLELAVAFIQAYVFCLLTTIYISEGYHLH